MRALLSAHQLDPIFLASQRGAFCLDRLTSLGLVVKRKKMAASIMAHELRIFIPHVGLCWSAKCMHRIAHVVRSALHLCSKDTMVKHLSWDMCCAFPLLIWGCGGVGNGNVVERVSAWWVHGAEHCKCAVILPC